jgi:diguanylate cyclase (GGDEF)-like protein/PAS domain S-box-containing protein
LSTRILIVDDEASVLAVLSHHLTNEGHECTTTTSPLEALRLLKGDNFALLISDLVMPEMSGLDLVREAKKVAPETSVIFITVVLEVNKAIEAVRAGADDYVLKPFNLGEISTSVSKVIEKRSFLLRYREHSEELKARVEQAASDLAQVNRELQETKEYLENLLHSSLDAILTATAEGRIEFANEGAAQMLGYRQQDFVGMEAAGLCVGGQDELQYIRRVLRETGAVKNYESELRRKDGSLVPVNMSISVVRNADAQVTAALAVCKDVTEQKQLEQQLKEMSIKDSLTGLYNHRHFFDRLEMEIERARRQEHPLSLLLLDIDKFKSYNDTHGHLEGDEVLQAVGSVVKECTRDFVDLGFRYGGDEFTVILPEAEEEQALRIAERIRKKFEEHHFDHLTLSIGLMAHQKGVSVRTFVQFADTMMYEAKRSGGNRTQIYQSEAKSIAQNEEETARP